VTEWAVAPIPASAPEAPENTSAIVSTIAPQQFPVDEEPAEVEAAASAPQPPIDGTVDQVPAVNDAPLDDDVPYDDEPPYDPEYDAPGVADIRSAPAPTPNAAQAPKAAPSASASRAPEWSAPTARTRAADGVERRGEAVIRQVLGAKFLREEPYQPPTRFN
jgi:DNA polymerase-3 subunit gamma/tau